MSVNGISSNFGKLLLVVFTRCDLKIGSKLVSSSGSRWSHGCQGASPGIRKNGRRRMAVLRARYTRTQEGGL